MAAPTDRSDREDPAPDALPGVALGRCIAHGARGRVWLARQLVPDRSVIVKLPASTELFTRESAALSSLDHPAFPKLLAAGPAVDSAPAHLVIEHRPGSPLTLCAGDTSIDDAVAIGGALFDALEHCHARGVVHGDLSADHVLVAPPRSDREEGSDPCSIEERLTIIDLGESRIIDGDDRTAFPSPDTDVATTPIYASPERRGAAGRPRAQAPATFSSDVYAAGLVLHELLCGRNPLELGARVSGEDPRDIPPPSRWRGAVGVDLDTIVIACLHPDPAERPTAATVRDDLRALMAGRPISLRPASWRRKVHALLATRPVLRRTLTISIALLATGALTALIVRARVDHATTLLEGAITHELDLLSELLTEERDSSARVGTKQLRETLVQSASTLSAGEHTPPAALAQLHQSLGELATENRQHRGALWNFEIARRQWELAAAEAPLSLENQRDAIVTEIRIGDVHNDLGETALTRERYMYAHRKLERLHEDHPAHLGVLDDLGYSFERLASFELARWEVVAARPRVQRRREIAEQQFTRVEAARARGETDRKRYELSLRALYQGHLLEERWAAQIGRDDLREPHLEAMDALATQMLEEGPERWDVRTRAIGARYNARAFARKHGSIGEEEFLRDLEALIERARTLFASERHRSSVFELCTKLRERRIELLILLAEHARAADEVRACQRELVAWAAGIEADDRVLYSTGRSSCLLADLLEQCDPDSLEPAEWRAEGLAQLRASTASATTPGGRLLSTGAILLRSFPTNPETLALAEACCRRLIERDGGASIPPLELLARILEARGSSEEAAEIRAKVSSRESERERAGVLDIPIESR